MATLSLQVGASADDGEMVNSANDVGRNVTVVGVVSITVAQTRPGSRASNNECSSGFRFQGVTIPQGSTINSATFGVTAHDTYDASPGVVSYHVSGQADDNAGAFSATNGDLNITARPRTTADAGEWVHTSQTAGTQYTVDVTAVVQEIINRAGWSSGNALVILLDTHANTTVGEFQLFRTYDGSAADAATLDIDYATGGGSTSQARFLALRGA